MDSKLLMPMRELRPVLEIRMLFAWVTPVLPKDNCCRAGKAVKFIESTVVNCGIERVERTVRAPSVKPPRDLRDPNSTLARFVAPTMVKLFVIFSIPSTDSDCPPWPLAKAASLGIVTDPLYVVQAARAVTSAGAETVKVAELLH